MFTEEVSELIRDESWLKTSGRQINPGCDKWRKFVSENNKENRVITKTCSKKLYETM
jgi:hypothetical protein